MSRTILINACPHCLALFVPVRIPANFKTMLAACEVCGNLIVLFDADNGIDSNVGTLKREWFVDNFTEKARKEIHEKQERILHSLGLWG